MKCVILLALLALLIRIVYKFVNLYSPTTQRLIDWFHLNEWVNKQRASDLSLGTVMERVSEIFDTFSWDCRLNKRRNGFQLTSVLGFDNNQNRCTIIRIEDVVFAEPKKKRCPEMVVEVFLDVYGKINYIEVATDSNQMLRESEYLLLRMGYKPYQIAKRLKSNEIKINRKVLKGVRSEFATWVLRRIL